MAKMSGVSAHSSIARRSSSIVLCLLIVAGFFLRLAPIGRYVTPDEPNWVYRSVRFSDAVAVGRWSEIPPTGHPGVTTMWLGTLGIHVRRWLSPEESSRHLDWIRRLAWLDPEIGEPFRHLAFFLPGGRIAIALVTSLSLVLMFLMLSRLFDRTVALVTVGLLAFDPFLVGHSGLLHTDALLATFGMLTLLAAFNGLRQPLHVAWWPLAGLFAGLTLLTKSPGLIIIGFVALLPVLSVVGPAALRSLQSFVGASKNFRDLLRPVLLGLLFVSTLAITFASLHPGVWADPVGVLQDAFFLADRHLTSVQRPIFFAGETVLDPGPAFYPVVLLFRLSPLVLLGLMFGLAHLPHLPSDRKVVFAMLLVFAVLFSVGISFSTKKHDRYLLPIFPPLALAAALGVDALLICHGRSLVRRLQSSVGSVAGFSVPQLLALVVVLLQAILALTAAAYPLNHYNPLLGGVDTASRVLPTGWGEGWSAAAHRLNRLPDARELTVAVSSVPSFSAMFGGRTLPLNDETIPLADYVVQDQADEVPPNLSVLESLSIPSRHRPTTIYENLAPSEQADWLRDRAGSDDLILLDADTPLLRRYVGPAEIFSTEALPHEAALADWLGEHVPGRQAVWLVMSTGASPITARHVHRQLEAIASPERTSVVASSTITRFAVQPTPPITRPVPYRANFGGQMALVDGSVPPSAVWPQLLDVTVRWQNLRDSESDHQALVVLRAGDGHSWASRESLVRNGNNFATSGWRAGEWADVTYQLRVPPGIPPDRYRVEVSLYDTATGARLGSVGPDGAFQGTHVHVGDVDIGSPVDPPRVSDLNIDEILNLKAGPLRLIGMNAVTEEVLSGDSLSVELFWQADEAPVTDHRVRWRLRGPQDEVGLELEAPLSSYPTSRWQRGDRFQVHYDLRVSPLVSPGVWHVMLNVVDEAGRALWEQDRALVTVDVLPRERAFTLPDDIPHPMDVRFGDTIHLRGYGLSQATVRPGQLLPVTLYWEADGPTDRSYTLFVHLVGPDGRLAGQVDRIPGAGAVPTSSWAPGQVIVEEVLLPVAPDASVERHRIAVGFYDAAYGGRLEVVDADGEVLPQNQALLPAEIAVTP